MLNRAGMAGVIGRSMTNKVLDPRMIYNGPARSAGAAARNQVLNKPGTLGLLRQRKAHLGADSAGYKKYSSSVNGRAQDAYRSAYNDRMKLTRRRYTKGAVAFAGLGMSNRSKTGPNQSTFAARGMRSQGIVGFSSGALQGFSDISGNRSIGGMTS